MVLTLPALASFGIIARPKRLGGGVGFLLPHTARAGQHMRSVSRLWVLLNDMAVTSNRQTNSRLLLLIILIVAGLFIYMDRSSKKSAQTAMQILTSLQAQQVISFKIHPVASNPPTYEDAIEFQEEREMLVEFLKSITDIQSYHPQHDRALTRWGMQIQSNTTTIRMSCYIPDLMTGIIAGRIDTGAGYGTFQSHLLREWYQKYRHYWKMGEPHGALKPDLTTTSPTSVTVFKIISRTGELPTDNQIIEFSPQTQVVIDFFNAIKDIQYIPPRQKNGIIQWNIQVCFATTQVEIECFIPSDSPELVVGIIDTDVGYVYFSSQLIYKWYQMYTNEWAKFSPSQSQ